MLSNSAPARGSLPAAGNILHQRVIGKAGPPGSWALRTSASVRPSGVNSRRKPGAARGPELPCRESRHQRPGHSILDASAHPPDQSRSCFCTLRRVCSHAPFLPFFSLREPDSYLSDSGCSRGRGTEIKDATLKALQRHEAHVAIAHHRGLARKIEPSSNAASTPSSTSPEILSRPRRGTPQLPAHRLQPAHRLPSQQPARRPNRAATSISRTVTSHPDPPGVATELPGLARLRKHRRPPSPSTSTRKAVVSVSIHRYIGRPRWLCFWSDSRATFSEKGRFSRRMN